MASAGEFLTKQLNIQKEIVTFRRLSRALSIHVNLAKNELASFHALSKASDEPSYATYLITGDIAPVSASRSYRDDKAMELDDGELGAVSTIKILLVGENDLEAAKAQFARVSSVHIYSLSPSPVKDAALLAPMADYVRSYANQGKEFHQAVGVVVGADVKASKKVNTSIATSSKTDKSQIEKKPMDKSKDSGNSGSTTLEKARETKKGTLNWNKASTKQEKAKDASLVNESAINAKKDDKIISKKNVNQPIQEKTLSKKGSKATMNERSGSKKAIKKEAEESEMEVDQKTVPGKPKRGEKRRSSVMALSDSEQDDQDDNPAPKAKPRTSTSRLPSKAAASKEPLRVKKGALISDEEDDAMDAKILQKKNKGKGRAAVSDGEDVLDRSVRTVMDLDDSQFTRHNNNQSMEAQAKEEEEKEQEGDVDMASGSESAHTPLPTKRKRKPKKVIPIGSNGLPKKRVVKSRRSKDAKGYMITQDYSSYESASESEQAPVIPEQTKSTKRKQAARDGKKDLQKPTPPNARQKPGRKSKSTADGGKSSVEQPKPVGDNGETNPEAKTSSSVHGGGTRASSKGTSSNGGKKSLMNYFGKQ